MSTSTASNSFGVDTLQIALRTPNMEFEPRFDCEVQPMRVSSVDGKSNPPKFLYQTTSGARIHGQKAFLNTRDFQFSIVPDYNDGAPLALIQFSAKAFSENNHEPMDCAKLAHNFARVHDLLRQAGVKSNFDQAEIKRLDVALNIQTNEPFVHYSPILAAAQGLKRASKRDYGDGGHLFGNASWQGCVYGKEEEMRAKKAAGPPCPPRTVRAEMRSRNSADVCRRYGLEEATVFKLCAAWQKLRPAHRKMMKEHIFNHSASLFTTAKTDFDAAFEATRGSKRHIAAASLFVMADRLVSEKGLAGAKQYVRAQAELSERAYRDYDKALDVAHARLKLDGSAPSGSTLQELYREFEEKFLGD